MRRPDTEQLEQENAAYHEKKADDIARYASHRQRYAPCQSTIQWAGLGFLLGLAIGAFLASAGVFPFLTLTAAPDYYYVVEFDEAVEWLGKTLPAEDTRSKDAAQMVELPPWREIIEALPDSKARVENSLAAIHETLVGDAKNSSAVVTCLAFEDDPYNNAGQSKYLYIKIPASLARDVRIPEAWGDPLYTPKTGLFWIIVSCYPDSK